MKNILITSLSTIVLSQVIYAGTVSVEVYNSGTQDLLEVGPSISATEMSSGQAQTNCFYNGSPSTGGFVSVPSGSTRKCYFDGVSGDIAGQGVNIQILTFGDKFKIVTHKELLPGSPVPKNICYKVDNGTKTIFASTDLSDCQAAPPPPPSDMGTVKYVPINPTHSHGQCTEICGGPACATSLTLKNMTTGTTFTIPSSSQPPIYFWDTMNSASNNQIPIGAYSVSVSPGGCYNDFEGLGVGAYLTSSVPAEINVNANETQTIQADLAVS
ncbi:hypothetical protein OAO18_06445 [Francisellaceae bacterium]|nr:hypothetical protein [Francisellaceae bacterium]